MKASELFKNVLANGIEGLVYTSVYLYQRAKRTVTDKLYDLSDILRNIRKYLDVLYRDRDFDYVYLEDLILKKLEWMDEFFKKYKPSQDSQHYLKLAIRLGKIAFQKDMEEDKEHYGGKYATDYTGYVNTKNYKKFYPTISRKELFDHPYWGNVYKTELRRQKAKRLFYKCIANYSSLWWN